MPTKTKINVTAAPESSVAVQKIKFYQRPLFWASIIAVLLLGLSAFLGWQNQKLKTNLAVLQNQIKSGQNSGQPATSDSVAAANKQLVDAVGKLIILPQDEQPTAATVTDLEKLRGQPFFVNAAVGDKVLIYTNAKKAVLYRPSENKIIETAPLNIGAGTSGAQGEKLSVEIRNGSGVSGAGGQMKAKLAAHSEFTVTRVTNAKATYPKTILFLSNASKSGLAASLQTLTSAQSVSALPAGEPASSADAVLILGQQ